VAKEPAELPFDAAFESASEASSEYEERAKAMLRGVDPRPSAQRMAPGPTHTSPCSYLETNQRAPYMAAEEIRKPGLDEGVAARQKIT
jgi:hypothetical protein